MTSARTHEIDITSRFCNTGHVETQGLLGRVVYGVSGGRPSLEQDVPTLHLKMYESDSFIETWRSSGTVRSGSFEDLVFAHDDAFLFCAGFIPSSDRYTAATRQAYSDAFALIRELKFPQLFRMWNFIPAINGENGEGLEVYRDFCRGRALAFEDHFADAAAMPAATGIGTWGEGVGFYFLACRNHDVKHIENTRQTPAYDYPQRYGPKPPSFARATQLSKVLYVSGTASIVGHETLHAGDLDKQWETAIGNIAHLIGAENLHAQGAMHDYDLRDLDQIKVYYRHAADLPRVVELAGASFDANASVRFLNVDICRADLLVEIEGIACRYGHDMS